MKIIKFNLARNWQDLDYNIIEIAAGVIQRGGSIVYPTDTVYGLGVNALREDSIEHLFKIKKRPETKPVPIIVRDIEMAKRLAYINKKQEKILESVWPGQVTAILEKRGIVSDILTAGKRTVGLRIADCEFTKLLMESLEEPITATSANFSGEPSLIRSVDVIKIFNKAHPHPDLFLDAGDLPESPASTVLDLTSQSPKITRVGPISKKDLMEMLK